MATLSAPPSALVASSSAKPPASSTPSSPAAPRPHQAAGGQPRGNGNGRGRHHRGGRGHGGSHGGPQGGHPSGQQSAGGQQWPSIFNPWTGSNPGGRRGPPPRVAAPPSPQQALMAGAPPGNFPPPSAYYQAPQQASPYSWLPTSWTSESLTNAFNTVALTPPPDTSDWVIDSGGSGASSHIASNPGMVIASPFSSFPSSIVVGNGVTLPVVGTGYSILPRPFRLNNVLVALFQLNLTPLVFL